MLQLYLLFEGQSHDLRSLRAEIAAGVVRVFHSVFTGFQLHEDRILYLMRRRHLCGHTQDTVILVQFHWNGERRRTGGIIDLTGGLYIGISRR